mgnify:FL=1
MKIILLFFILTHFCFSQKSEIKGKIISESTNLEGIHVINKTQNKGVVTTSGGYFAIQAIEKDTLIFSAVNLEAVNHVVKREDFSLELLFIKMKALVSQLEEVTMTKYKNITPEALGIIPTGMKTYTPAERKLKTASEITLGTIVSLDAIINGISGRTAMLKKELKVERKELLMQQILENYERAYFNKELGIPEEYVEGFLFFAVESDELAKAIKNGNKPVAGLLLSDLAINFLAISNEK